MRAPQTPLGFLCRDLDAPTTTPSLAPRALLHGRRFLAHRHRDEIAHAFNRFAGQRAKSPSRHRADFTCARRFTCRSAHRLLRSAHPRRTRPARMRVIDVISGVIIAARGPAVGRCSENTCVCEHSQASQDHRFTQPTTTSVSLTITRRSACVLKRRSRTSTCSTFTVSTRGNLHRHTAHNPAHTHLRTP